jgi:hypothetical protein
VSAEEVVRGVRPRRPGELENRRDDPAYARVRTDLLALLADVVNPQPRRLFNTGSLA